MTIARGILLKGNGMAQIAQGVCALALFLVAIATLALMRYRQTLD